MNHSITNPNAEILLKTREVAIYIAPGIYFPVRTVFIYANGTVLCVSQYDFTMVLMGILEMHKYSKSKLLYGDGMFSICFAQF